MQDQSLLVKIIGAAVIGLLLWFVITFGTKSANKSDNPPIKRKEEEKPNSNTEA